METVIKVSSKQKEKEKEEAEPPPKTPDASPPPQKPHKTGWGWRTEDSPPPPAMPPPAKALSTATKPKDKGKHKVKEVNVESEVDRLIDSQDNVYVLSRPKCGPAAKPTCLVQIRADVTSQMSTCCSLWQRHGRCTCYISALKALCPCSAARSGLACCLSMEGHEAAVSNQAWA